MDDLNFKDIENNYLMEEEDLDYLKETYLSEQSLFSVGGIIIIIKEDEIENYFLMRDILL